MTLIIKNILNIIKILTDNTSPKQITWSLLLGLGLGLSPLFSLQFFLFLIILLFFNVQFSLAFSSSFFFRLLFIPLASTFHLIGNLVLTQPAFRGIFTDLINIPLIPFTNFNNTIVMGSFIFWLVTLPFFYLVFLNIVERYQEKIVSKIKKSKLYLFLKASFFVKWYEKYERIYR